MARMPPHGNGTHWRFESSNLAHGVCFEMKQRGVSQAPAALRARVGQGKVWP